MSTDLLTFTLLSISSLLIIVNPLSSALAFISLTTNLPAVEKERIARDACWYALIILLTFTIAGGFILQLFGISLQAFRIAGGILLFGIGMEMVYAKTSRTRLTATEKYESREADDIAIMPLATPLISGPGAITTAIVLMNEAQTLPLGASVVVILSGAFALLLTYLMMSHADWIVNRVGQREYRAINRLMGMLLIAIAVELVITGIKGAFPFLGGG